MEKIILFTLPVLSEAQAGHELMLKVESLIIGIRMIYPLNIKKLKYNLLHMFYSIQQAQSNVGTYSTIEESNPNIIGCKTVSYTLLCFIFFLAKLFLEKIHSIANVLSTDNRPFMDL